MEHLTEYQIASFLDKKLSEPEKLKIIGHLNDCEECYNSVLEIYNILKDKTKLENYGLNNEIRKKAFSFGFRYSNTQNLKIISTRKRKIAISFAFILSVICLAIIFSINQNETKKQFREYENDISLKLITPQEEAVIDKKNLFFEWEKLDNVLTYRITLYNALGKVLIDTSIESNVIDLTGKINSLNNRNYFWDVKAVYSNGKTITSTLNVFVIE